MQVKKMHATRWVPLGMSICLFGLGISGCAGSSSSPNADDQIRSEYDILISAARGISFRTLAGAPVDPQKIITRPGSQNLRFNVRRSLRDLKIANGAELFSVGSCRVRFAAEPGSDFEVFARPFLSRRLQVEEGKPGNGREKDMAGVTIHVLNLTTGAEYMAPAGACSIRLDCSSVDQTLMRVDDDCNVD